MRIDITEVKPKNKIIKIVILVLFALLFIAIFSILGIQYAKSYKSKLIAAKKQQLNTYINNSNKNLTIT